MHLKQEKFAFIFSTFHRILRNIMARVLIASFSHCARKYSQRKVKKPNLDLKQSRKKKFNCTGCSCQSFYFHPTLTKYGSCESQGLGIYQIFF